MDEAKVGPKIKSIVAISLISTLFIWTYATCAMPLPTYDKMSPEDYSHYTTLLVKGARDFLIARGRPADAEKLLKFFGDSSKKGGTAQSSRAL
jgi:hypothetical protein